MKAYIVDPVVVDELAPLARCSGAARDARGGRSSTRSNQKATARKAAARARASPTRSAPWSSRTWAAAPRSACTWTGRVVDVNNALDGEGPFAIERAGTVPAGDWMRYVLARQHDGVDLQTLLTGTGRPGRLARHERLPGHRAGGRRVAGRGRGGGRGAAARARPPTPGPVSTARLCDELDLGDVLRVGEGHRRPRGRGGGKVDAVVLTGGLARSERVVGEIRDGSRSSRPCWCTRARTSWRPSPSGVLAVLRGEAEPRVYEG